MTDQLNPLDLTQLDAGIEITALCNGLRVVTDRMDGVASASLGVWVGAGARHETAAQNGVAHFLEHMAFKGTATRTARDIAEQIEDVGGYLNAYTSREATAFYARVLKEDGALAFDILADILRNPTFAAEDIEVERGVILQEIGMTQDTPDDIVFDWAQERSFPDQALGRPILGPAANVERFDASAFSGFMAERYAPDQMVIAAAGAVDHAEVVALAERLFGDLPAITTEADPAAAYEGGERRVEKDLEQAHVVLGFKAPSYLDEDYFAARVYATLLGGGMSSRLFQEAREARGLCYAIYAQPEHYRDAGLMTVYAGTGAEQTQELLEVVIDQMRSVADGPAQAEVARAVAQMRAGMLMGLEAPSSRCERIARSLLSHGRIPPIAELMEKLTAVDAAGVAAFGGRLNTAATPTLTLYGPIAGAPSLDALSARLAA